MTRRNVAASATGGEMTVLIEFCMRVSGMAKMLGGAEPAGLDATAGDCQPRNVASVDCE